MELVGVRVKAIQWYDFPQKLNSTVVCKFVMLMGYY